MKDGINAKAQDQTGEFDHELQDFQYKQQLCMPVHIFLTYDTFELQYRIKFI